MTNIAKKIGAVELCMYMVILFASFDIFLTVDIAGYTFRIAQVFLIIGILLYIFNIYKTHEIYLPISYKPMFVWIALQCISIVNSPNKRNAILYFCWLIMDIFIIFIIQHYFIDKIDKIIRFYLFSMTVIGLLGICQWILALAGIKVLYTTGMFGAIPRINGFCFEPSYYATYLLPGWVICIYLLEKASIFVKKKILAFDTIVLTIALILCGSRMGWLCMGIWLVFRFFVQFTKLFQKKVPRKSLYIVSISVLLVVLLIIFVSCTTRFFDFSVFFKGLGINGTSSHSFSIRLNQIKNMCNLFFLKPLLGFSLGGVSAEYAIYYGLPFATGLTMCVWLELLVASGIFGFSFFVIWLVGLLRKAFDKKSKLNNEMFAFAYGLIFECIILAFNQNILRLYFWILISIINLMCVYTKRRNNGECDE